MGAGGGRSAGGSGSGANSGRGYVRFRVVYLGRPKANRPPKNGNTNLDSESMSPTKTNTLSYACKTIPDFESAGSCWCKIEDVIAESEKLPLRGSEPATWLRYVMGGGTVSPMSVLSGVES